MTMLQCNTCQGVYPSVGPDGVAYAHVCPPVHALKVRHLDGSITIVAPGALVAGDIVIADVFLPMKNARNENPDTSQPPVNGKLPMISAGTGVTPVLVVAVPVVGVAGV